jgi:hypothetical protein
LVKSSDQESGRRKLDYTKNHDSLETMNRTAELIQNVKSDYLFIREPLHS